MIQFAVDDKDGSEQAAQFVQEATADDGHGKP